MADNTGELFLIEDVDDEKISPVDNVETPKNLNWIHSRKGVEYLCQVLKIVSAAAEETTESKIAKSILSAIQKTTAEVLVVNFLKEISVSFLQCYKIVENVKCPKKKAINLENKFVSLSGDLSMRGKWNCLLNCCCGVNKAYPTGYIVMNHILQHFWSYLILNESCGLSDESDKSGTVNDTHYSASINDISAECSTSSSTGTDHVLEDIEVESIKEHGGWVLKRVRDMFLTGPLVHKIQVSQTNKTFCEVSKQHVLDLIKRLGQDVLMQPGKYLFIPKAEVVPIFTYLHSAVEMIVKVSLEADSNKDILKDCLQILSEDKQLRELWYNVLGNTEDELFKASCVLVLQRIVVMFLKSKQQIIREQLQLKAKKQSSSLRQS